VEEFGGQDIKKGGNNKKTICSAVGSDKGGKRPHVPNINLATITDDKAAVGAFAAHEEVVHLLTSIGENIPSAPAIGISSLCENTDCSVVGKEVRDLRVGGAATEAAGGVEVVKHGADGAEGESVRLL
jgi:hypothetical protein